MQSGAGRKDECCALHWGPAAQDPKAQAGCDIKAVIRHTPCSIEDCQDPNAMRLQPQKVQMHSTQKDFYYKN